MNTPKRMTRHLWWLAGGLLMLQSLIVAGGVGGIYAVDTARSFVTGESHYVSNHQAAVHQLTQYLHSGDPADFADYQDRVATPLAFANARILLENPDFELTFARRFLVRGGLHPEEAWLAALAYRWLGDTPLLRPALASWAAADAKILQLDALAMQAFALLEGEAASAKGDIRQQLRARLDRLDSDLFWARKDFAAQIGAAARTVRAWTAAGVCLLAAFVTAVGLYLARRSARTLTAAEANLRRERHLFRDIALTTGDWIWTTDEALRFAYLSDRLEDVSGRANATYLGGALADFPDDPDVRTDLSRTLERREPFRDITCTHHAADGTALKIRLSGTPAFGSDGGFLGYRGTGADITSEIAARADADARQELIEVAFNNLPEGILVIDADRRLRAYNPAFTRMLDIDPEEPWIGAPAERLIERFAERGEYGRVGNIDRFVRERIDLMTAPDPSTIKHTRPDGTVLEIRCAPLPSGGQLRINTDITHHLKAQQDLRLARDAAQSADAAKTHFLANMSHELRTPLNAINGYAELMRMQLLGPLGDPRYLGYADNILSSGRHLQALVDDVLDLSKLELGTLALNPTPLDLLDAARAALVMQGEPLSDRVRTEIPSGLRVLCDSRALTQVIGNVVGNALKFSEDAPVDISARRAGRFVRLTVRDQGPGIPPDDLPRVTEPFFTQGQGAMVAGAEPSGSGIGLALTHQLVEASDGMMEIKSAPDAGTSVDIYLPAESASVTDLAPHRKAS